MLSVLLVVIIWKKLFHHFFNERFAYFLKAHNIKKGKKLHQGLDISVISTTNHKLKLQWDWAPDLSQIGFKVWYSVLVLGTKFTHNVNSHKR